jgi:glucosamine--fructose-6-phosphate aminotransferase (isomerizing)
VRHARAQKAWVMAVTNTVGSTISRESDAALYTRGGPEVAVASTKAVMTQITAMYVVGLYLAQVARTRDRTRCAPTCATCRSPDLRRRGCCSRMDGVREPARQLRTSSGCCSSAATSATRWRSRGAQAQGARLRRARASPAGEIKHGPIALVEQGTPVVVIAPRHALQAKLVNNVQRCAPAGPAPSSWRPTATTA